MLDLSSSSICISLVKPRKQYFMILIFTVFNGSPQEKISYLLATSVITRMINSMKNTPPRTPAIIHFNVSSLLVGFTGFSVGDVVGLNRTPTLTTFAPTAVLSFDLCFRTMLSSALIGSTDSFPMKSPQGCCS